MLQKTMKTSVGDFSGDANICILNKLQIGGHILENVVALAVSFERELKDHILLGANVTNNWKFTLSRLENTLEVTEQFSETVLQRQYSYKYCYNNKSQVIAFQDMGVQRPILNQSLFCLLRFLRNYVLIFRKRTNIYEKNCATRVISVFVSC